MKKTTLFITLLLLATFQTALCQPQKTLVFIGDSFTDGDGVKKEKAFTALVDAQLADAKGINQGRSGWATSSYLRRWDEVEKKLPKAADQVFIQLGGNDLRIDGHSKETIQTCRVNMEEIAQRIKRKYPSASIVLMSSVKIEPEHLSPQIRDAGFGAHSNKYLKRIGKAYKKLAKEKGYGFIDLIPAIPSNSTHDGAHLNEAGHEAISQKILAYLESNR